MDDDMKYPVLGWYPSGNSYPNLYTPLCLVKYRETRFRYLFFY